MAANTLKLRAVARRLANGGAAVALVARRRDRLQALAASIENAGGTALAVEADITDRAQADAAFQQAAGRFGRLDILVNNAGLIPSPPSASGLGGIRRGCTSMARSACGPWRIRRVLT